MTDTPTERPRAKSPDWGKAAVGIFICVASMVGLLLTKDANCLWALVIIPILYKAF